MNKEEKTLPIYKGYTVDFKNWEFRKGSEVIPLISDKGARLFWEFRQTKEGLRVLKK